MKTIFTSLLTLLTITTLLAQSPQGINYQVIARDNNGEVLSNESLNFQITITTTNGAPFTYKEEHNPTSNNFGLCQFVIGKGINKSGSFENIPWEQGTIINIKAGVYDFGSASFQSVPYALYTETAQTANTLKDFDISSATDGQFMVKTTSGWVAQGLQEPGNPVLKDITAQDITNWGETELPNNANDDEILTYDNGEWVAIARPEPGNPVLKDITTQDITHWGTKELPDNPSPGDIVSWDGTEWVAKDTTNWGTKELPSSATDEDILTYDTGEWVAIARPEPGNPVLKDITTQDISNWQEKELPTTPNTGDIVYWNGTSWTSLNPPTPSILIKKDPVLVFEGGKPQWRSEERTTLYNSVMNPTCSGNITMTIPFKFEEYDKLEIWGSNGSANNQYTTILEMSDIKNFHAFSTKSYAIMTGSSFWYGRFTTNVNGTANTNTSVLLNDFKTENNVGCVVTITGIKYIYE